MRYRPADSLASPRFSGPRTFMRLPHLETTEDVDFGDPAFAPGTGTPEVGGPSSELALGYLRSLQQLDVRGCDCVEVAPAYDPGGITALLAATVCHEMLSLLALRRR